MCRAALAYLNQSLPEEKQIIHHAWDMASCNKKAAAGTVLKRLELISQQYLKVSS